MPDRFLITGGGGQLASDIGVQLEQEADVIAPSHADLDITDDAAVLKTLEAVRPTVVINCAAFHNVEACERQEEHAFAVNACAVKRLAERCAQLNARACTSAPTTSSTAPRRNRAGRALCRIRRARLRDLEACRRARGAVIRPGVLVVRSAGLTAAWQRVEGWGTSSPGCLLALAKGQAHRGRGSAFDADVDGGPGGGDRRRRRLGRERNAAPHERGGDDVARLYRGDHGPRGLDVDVSGDNDVARSEGRRPSAERAFRSTVAPDAGLEPLRPWREALAEFPDRAGLRAAVHEV